jgi:phosphotriesterase-related protein
MKNGRRRMKVQTILGVKDASELGFTLIHEHLLTRPPRILAERDVSIQPYEDTVLDSVEKAIQELRDFARAGGKTLIEATPITYGRDIMGLAEIARRVPEVNIIVSTGFYLAETFDEKWVKAGVNDMARMLIEEIKDGIDSTSYKAGVIKVATGFFRIHPLEEKALRAAAIAHHETGAPIQVHTTYGTMGDQVAKLLRGEGVDAKKILILHLDTNLDKWCIKKVLENEVYISFDRLARLRHYVPDGLKLKFLDELVNEGFEDQLMVSMDAGRRIYWKSYGGGPGLSYIPEVIVGRLKNEFGWDNKLVEKIFIDNPSRYLGFIK